MEDMHSIPRVIVEAMEAGISASKAYRIYSDRTIPELAADAQVEPCRVCMIEAGSAPTHSEALAIGRALEMPVRLIGIGEQGFSDRR